MSLPKNWKFISDVLLLNKPVKLKKKRKKITLYYIICTLNIPQQIQFSKYLLGSNQVILPLNQCIFDLSKKVDCIKLYTCIKLEFTESIKSVNITKNMFEKLHKKIVEFNRKTLEAKGITDYGKEKQYAWAALRRNDGSFYYFDIAFPCPEGNNNKQKHDSAKIKHSEDFLIDRIKTFFGKKSKYKYTELFIYSVNTPCLGRKGQDPCMIKLINLSKYLHGNYNIKTYIGFSKFYVCGDLKRSFPYLSFSAYEWNCK